MVPSALPIPSPASMDRRNLLRITLADFLVRTAYQMGKTPLLPLFAAALGASDLLLGTVVAVSTVTGMVTKPLFGFLSDRLGRRLWILIGTALFAGIPFLYRFVETPGQLVLLRLIHGTATAIYGPVTVAYVAEQSPQRKAERLGWFSMARSGGYILGPALGGWLLLWMEPVQLFALIGGISLAAFLPVLGMSERGAAGEGTGGLGRDAKRKAPRLHPSSIAFHVSRLIHSFPLHTPAIWLSGGLEAAAYLGLYAAKAFLPVYALSAGVNVAVVGLFFSLQETTLILLKPAGGRFGDRVGYLPAIALGMLGMGLALPLLTVAGNAWLLLALAGLLGATQALLFPATVALVAAQVGPSHLGAGMGMVGALKNGGKVAGPVLAGLLVQRLGYPGMFRAMGMLLGLGATWVWLLAQRRERVERAARSPVRPGA